MIDHLSPSQIRMWLRCPKQWEFRYVKGVKIPPSGAMVLGSAYHEGLAKRFQYVIDNKEQPPPELALDTFDTTFDRIRGENQIYSEDGLELFDEIVWEDDPGEMKDVGVTLVQRYDHCIAPSIDPLAVETKEIMLIEDATPTQIPVHMVLDLETPASVVDHKVKKRRFSEGDLQQDIQATAYWMASGKPLEFHVALKQKEPQIVVQPAAREDSVAEWFASQVVDIWRAIHAGVFVPNDQGWHCSPGFCGYWQACKGRK